MNEEFGWKSLYMYVLHLSDGVSCMTAAMFRLQSQQQKTHNENNE